MSTHLREHYGESISPTQLSMVLDLCDRQVDVSLNKKDSCLICGEELLLLELQGHLAAHMEDIALFVLPNTDEGEQSGGSKASVQVAKLKSKDKTSDTESEANSLGFSAAPLADFPSSHPPTSLSSPFVMTPKPKWEVPLADRADFSDLPDNFDFGQLNSSEDSRKEWAVKLKFWKTNSKY
jgi:hypothetical protein